MFLIKGESSMPQSSRKYEGAYSELGYQRKAVVPAEVAKHLKLQNKDRLVWEIIDGKAIVYRKLTKNST